MHLFGARDGALWIGASGGLASWKDGQLTQYPALSGFFVQGLAEDHDGTVWAGGWGSPTGKGKLCAIRNGSATCYGDDGVFGDGVRSLYEDAEGGLWVNASSGLWRWKPGPPVRYAAEAHSLTQGENGSGLTFFANGKIRQVAGGRITDYQVPEAPFPLTAGPILRDRHGALWVGTTRGLLYSYEGTTRLISRSDGLSGDGAFEIFEDREGTIWAATPDGLDSFRELPFASLSITQGPSGVLAARDGSLWIGTGAGLNQRKDGRTRVYRAQSDPSLLSDAIGTLFQDERGRIWFKTNPDGMAVFEEGRFRAVPSVPPGIITSIASDYHGGVWIHLWGNPNDYGLVHLVNGKVVEKISWKDLGGGPGAGLVVDPDGGVWTGLFSGGIVYFRAGEIRNLQLSGPDTGSRRILDLSRERDGALWAASENGLIRIANGRVSTLTTANGLPCNTVHWIMEDNMSSYWLLTACGLLQVAQADLEAWTADPKRKIRPTIFGAADGISLRGVLPPTRPHVTKLSDGRIWFENDGKATVIDPTNLGVNTIPPAVHIEQISADGSTRDAVRGLHLPALVRNVTIDYTALSLAVPEKVRFRYKLEGQDPDWREVINDREVQYSNLPPRSYRFRVTASNNSGVWNETGDVLDFAIDPAYYQTAWFRASTAGVTIVLLVALYRYRLRRLAREYNVRMDERVEERTRIARDLHDTLLQTFHGLMLRLQAVEELLPPGKARSELEDTLQFGDQAVVEARNAVHELRSSATADTDLLESLRALGNELAGKTTANFRFIVEGHVPDVNPIVRDEIYRVAREALRNAVAHSAANQIEIEITYDERLLRLRVRDDGKGISQDILEKGREGHYGLPGMRERAKAIGAELTIVSGPGVGTEIELTVPGPVASARPPFWTGLWPFRKVAG